MANRTCDRLKFKSVALVILGWLAFAAAVAVENPAIRFLCLVAARALPPVLVVGRCNAPTCRFNPQPHRARSLANLARLSQEFRRPCHDPPSVVILP